MFAGNCYNFFFYLLNIGILVWGVKTFTTDDDWQFAVVVGFVVSPFTYFRRVRVNSWSRVKLLSRSSTAVDCCCFDLNARARYFARSTVDVPSCPDFYRFCNYLVQLCSNTRDILPFLTQKKSNLKGQTHTQNTLETPNFSHKILSRNVLAPV